MKYRIAVNTGRYVDPPLLRSMTADIQPLPAPRCETCAGPVRFGSDAYTGVSTVWCPRCGERALPRYGTVVYDQRVDLDGELDASVERAKKRVDPERSLRGQVGRHGDSWRQVSHKKASAA